MKQVVFSCFKMVISNILIHSPITDIFITFLYWALEVFNTFSNDLGMAILIINEL